MPVEGFPSQLTTLLKNGWVNMYPLLEIFFSNSTVMRLSTIPITEPFGNTYDPGLKKVNAMKASLSRSVDRVEMVLENADLRYGDFLLDDSNDSILENVPATYSILYQDPRSKGSLYRITKMTGILYTYLESGNTDLNLTLISDAYAGGGVAPYEVKPSCVWKYKDGINCDYSGSLPSCDLSFDGINGCITHFGFDMARARFGGGARDLDEESKATFDPLTTVGNGGGGGTGYCFMGSTPIEVDGFGSTRPIRELKAGDPIFSFNKETFETTDDKAANDRMVAEYRNWYSLVFSDGSSVEVTEDHPFIPQPGLRIRTRDLELGQSFRRFVDGNWRTVKLISKSARSSHVPTPFYNVPVAANHTYFANGFPVSNRKDPLEDELPIIVRSLY